MIKKYSLNINTANNRVVSVEVDGVSYPDADQIPDEDDRARMLLLTETFTDFSDMALETLTGQSSGLSKIIPLIFLTVALVSLTIAAISAIGTRRMLAKEVGATGKVVDLVVQKGQDGKEFYYPVVEYYLPDGSLQTAQVTEGSWPPAYEKGDLVTVRYDPEQPRYARIASVTSSIGVWTIAIISGSLGLAFTIATVFAFWVLKKSPT